MGELTSGLTAQSNKPEFATSLQIEKIHNGYLVYPTASYIANYKRVFVTELSEVPAVLANMFGIHNDISNS